VLLLQIPQFEEGDPLHEVVDLEELFPGEGLAGEPSSFLEGLDAFLNSLRKKGLSFVIA